MGRQLSSRKDFLKGTLRRSRHNFISRIASRRPLFRTISICILRLVLSVLPVSVRQRTGQPTFTCGDPGATNRPGNSEFNNGSPFADGHAGTVYAGTAADPRSDPTTMVTVR